MSFFDKMKASIGIGNAKVDTQLEKGQLFIGEQVNGVVYVLGGKTEQEINGIYLKLMTEVERESDDKKYISHESIFRIKVSDGFTIGKSEEKRIPFSFVLPLQTPITLGSQDVWIDTELDVSFAVDPKDKDSIRVMPNQSVGTLLQAFDQLGFRLRKAFSIPMRVGTYHAVQEFEYVPTTEFRGRLDEVEAVFIPEASGITLLLEVDRKARGLGGFLSAAMGTDESKLRLSFTTQELTNPQGVTARLRETISRFS